MFKMLTGVLLGALIAVLVIGYVTGVPDLPGKEWLRKFWGPPGGVKAQGTAVPALWNARPRAVNGEVEVTAWGAAAADESKNRAHAVALALRTARHSAYEQLAEYLKGARTSGLSHYHGDMLERASLTTQTAAVIRGARIVREEVRELSDGSVRAVVTIRHPLPRKAGV